MIYHNESDKIDVKGEVRQFFYWIPSVAPMTEPVDSPSRSDTEIVNKWIPSVGRMTELVDALRSTGRMSVGSYLVNFGPFDLIFDPLWGFSVNIAC